MKIEPKDKSAIVYFDGQNLYRAAKNAYGHNHPNYDVSKLALWVCKSNSWSLKQVCFYTGVPSSIDDPHWNTFWTNKLKMMGKRGVTVFKRELRYHDGVGHEKGIDIRIALDIVRAALNGSCDVVVVFSQDQDLTEVAKECKEISDSTNRWLKVASVFPSSPSYKNKKGIYGTDWIPMDQATYDTCIDPIDYRTT